MPRILVVAQRDGDEPAVVHQEDVPPANLESDHYSAQLIERVGWAVLDAQELEGPERLA